MLLRKSNKERETRRTEKRTKFAWVPVRVTEGKMAGAIVWLEPYTLREIKVRIEGHDGDYVYWQPQKEIHHDT